MIKNVIFDYGKVLVDYSLQNLYDPVFDDKEEEKWFIENVVSLEFHNQLDLGRPTAECVAEWQAKFPKYKRELTLYDSDYMRLMGDEIARIEVVRLIQLGKGEIQYRTAKLPYL